MGGGKYYQLCKKNNDFYENNYKKSWSELHF